MLHVSRPGVAERRRYLLIDSTEIAVLQCRKAGEVWTPRLFEQASDEVGLPGLGIALPLAEIYLDIGLLPG
jgi:hypothetical protein